MLNGQESSVPEQRVAARERCGCGTWQEVLWCRAASRRFLGECEPCARRLAVLVWAGRRLGGFYSWLLRVRTAEQRSMMADKLRFL